MSKFDEQLEEALKKRKKKQTVTPASTFSKTNLLQSSYSYLPTSQRYQIGEIAPIFTTTKMGDDEDDIAPISTKTKMDDIAPAFSSINDTKLEELFSVSGNSDFGTKSGYISTKSDKFWDKLSSKYGMGYTDLQYEYINNQNNIRDEISQRAMSWGSDTGKTTSSYEEKALDYMTDDEVAVYNYYYQTEGKDKAQDFLDTIAETLNARKAGKDFTSLKGNTAREILYGAVSGTEQFEQGIKNVGKMILDSEDYIPQTSTQILSGMIREDLEDDGFKVLGNSVGQVAYDITTTAANMAPSILAGAALGPGAGLAFTGASAAGNAYQQALQEGQDKDKAKVYATMIGTAEATLQGLLGGIGKLGGTSATITRAISGIEKGMLRFALEYGGKIGSEALEEGLQEVLDPLFKNAVFGTDEKVNWEDVAYSSLLGGIMGAGFGASEVANTRLSDSEAAVVNKEFNNRVAEKEQNGKKLTNSQKNKIYDEVIRAMEMGDISTDLIDEVVGGETYQTYKKYLDTETKLRQEFDTLNQMKQSDMTGEQIDRRTELKGKLETIKGKELSTQMKKLLDQELPEKIKGTRLEESYKEIERRKQRFTADLSKYNDKQKATIQKAIDSGVLNNSNKTRYFVDFVAKLAEETKTPFNFSNKEKLIEAGFSFSDGKLPNGFKNKDGITINMSSSTAARSFVVGHEITHVLEGTYLYKELQKTIFDYAKKKGEYDSRLESITELYKKYAPDADPLEELTADLVGEYIFSDQDFVNNLSVKNQNVFQKVYSEIKHLLKLATAGSEEARMLEKAKRAFEKAYQKAGKQKNTADSGVKYAISALDNGNVYVTATRNVIEGKTKAEQRKEITNFFSALLDGNPSLDIHTIEGDVLTITKNETASKARDDYKTVNGKQVPMTDEEFTVKMHIESHIDEVAEVSKKMNSASDSKNHPFAKDGFTYRRAYFEDFDGQYYEVTLSIGHNGTIATVYNVGKIKGSVPPSAKVIAVVGSKPLGRTLSKSDISQNDQKVNGKFSLTAVAEVEPKSDKWHRTHTTEEAMARFPNMWNVASEESEVRNPTQITSTVNSYRKIYNFLQNEGFNGTILDASSGLGYGTRAGIEEYGFDVEDIEPFPDKGYNPKYKDYSTLNKKYDVIISNAVLNVLPQDQRDALAIKMGELLNDGGRMFINVRGKDVESLAKTGKNIHLGDMEWIETVKGSYQKGFTKDELKAYLEDALGDGFTVEKTNMFGAVSVVVTKNSGVKYSLSDSDGRQLSSEQQEFFKDSAIRDKDGNLMVLYHGTQNAFTVFDIGRSGENYDGWSEYGEGIYLTPEKKMAEYYGDNAGRGREVKLMEVYADIKKPFSTNDPVDFDISDLTQKYELTEFDERFMKKYGSRLIEFLSHHNESVRDYLTSKGFDGVWETIDGDVYQVVAYAENQVKNVDNRKPTADPDIRYSLSEDSDGNKLTEEQAEYFKNSKARDAKGRLIPVYHGTFSDFNIFDISKTSPINDLGQGHYFTSNINDANANYASSSGGDVQTKIEDEAYGIFIEMGFTEDDLYDNDHVEDYNRAYDEAVKRFFSSPRVIKSYLNITNPLYVKSNGVFDAAGNKVFDDFESEVKEWGVTLKDLGYDGIIDYTVAEKFPMQKLPEGTTHFVVFDSQQIKSVHNTKPTGNPDIRYSLSDSNKIVPGTLSELLYEAPADDDIAPVAEIAPVRESYAETKAPASEIDEAPLPGDADAPPLKVETVADRIQQKITNAQLELDKVRQFRDQAVQTYDEDIAQARAELKSKKNQDSKIAQTLKKRIERLTRLKADINADYDKRINDLEKRVEKLHSQEYNRAEHRREKQTEYTTMWEKIIGDTSTWKDMPLGLQYKTKTLRRILRNVVRDGSGNRDFQKADAIYDELETKYDHNEAQLKVESRKLKESFRQMKLTHEEDTYAQMLGEFRHNPETELSEEVVNEYYNKHKNKIDTAKVDKAITETRKLYDDLIVRVNEVLRNQGMKEIPYREGYFPHFTNPKQGWLAKLLNWKTIDTEIPTSIAGLTQDFKPQRSWQSFSQKRRGDTTDYSLYQGLDTYIHGALDWIYHIEDIQKRRALENYIRFTHSDEGVQKRINDIKAQDYDADEAQEMIDAVLKEAQNPLSNLVRELMNRTNTLANKKSSMDRETEENVNRKIYSTMTNINNRVTANMVVGSLSSALTNFIPMVQSWHQVSPMYTVKGLGDMIRSTVRDDGMVAKSDFLTNRLLEEENLYQTGWDKVIDKAAFMMDVIDNITSQTVWRSKYLQNLKEGMSETQAIKDADQFAKNLIAGRSRGNTPTIFDAKNPLTKIFTAFQLEVANQYGYMFEDVPQDSTSKVRLVKGYATAFTGAYLYNALYSSLVGRDAAFDPISIIEDLLKDLFGDDDEEEEPGDIILGLAKNIAEEVPFVGGLLGGGRIPVSSAIPYASDSNPLQSIADDVKAAWNEGDVREGDWKALSKEMLKPLYYLVMPVGGGQIKKTVEGLSMFSDDHPVAGSYTDSGKLRFPVEDTIGNRIQAGLFGQYSSNNARDYFDDERSPLSEKQIHEFADSGMSIQDYWKYRDVLKDLDKQAEKVEYINGLNLTKRQKTVLKSYLFDEAKYAEENPEKYAFLENEGIGYIGYKEADEDTQSAWSWAFKHQAEYQYYKANGVMPGDYSTYYIPMLDFENEDNEAYKWAFDNPEKATFGKVFSNGVTEYRRYASDLYEITADKDSSGKTISGSRKEKVIDYINSLDIDYGAKLILFKSEYKSDDESNYKIIDYLNSRDDISYEETVAILEELGFTVTSDGTIYWD